MQIHTNDTHLVVSRADRLEHRRYYVLPVPALLLEPRAVVDAVRHQHRRVQRAVRRVQRVQRHLQGRARAAEHVRHHLLRKVNTHRVPARRGRQLRAAVE